MKKEKKEKKEKKGKKMAVPAEKETATNAQADCDPLAFAFTIIGGKWKMRILWALSEKSGRRYGDIKRDIPEITDMMLSQSLRELTADGLVERIQFQEIPPRVEYSMTDQGKSLLPVLVNLREWSLRRMKQPH